jgi:hypothetical protein
MVYAGAFQAYTRMVNSYPFGHTSSMNRNHTILSLALAAFLVAPTAATAKVGSATFNGLVRHVSTNNIKVYDPHSGQTLSFVILPKFDQIFSADGKTTYQMKKLHPGQYVKVYYDQRLFGARHADRIFILNNANAVMGRQ